MARAELNLKPRKSQEKKARDFKLNYGDEAVSMWADWHTNHVLPFAGGKYDQPDAWHEDMAALDWELAVIKDRLRRGKSAQEPLRTEASDGRKRPKTLDEAL